MKFCTCKLLPPAPSRPHGKACGEASSNVELLLEHSSGERLKLTALSVPVIGSPLPSGVNVDYFHLEGLELADLIEEDNESHIDILIGSDFYWDLVSGDTIRGKTGPVVVRIRTDRKTAKLRVVYDESAKPDEGKISLNDFLRFSPPF